MSPFFHTPHGAALYDEHHLGLLARYGGVCYPLRDQALTTGAGAGVVQSLRGDYPGAVSGVTYYNQVVVTGTLNPNVAGTYTVGGMNDGRPFYTNGTYYLYWDVSFGAWRLLAAMPFQNLPRWSFSGVWPSTNPVTGGGGAGATGTATVANVPASGVYLFTPSGVTLQSAGPPLAGELVKAAGLTATGYVAVGASVFDPSGAISFSAWVNMTAVAGATEQFILGCALSSTKRLSLSVKSSVLAAAYSNGTTSYACSGTALTGWHHVAFIKASGNNTPVLYIDGVVQTGTTAPTFASTNNTLIGARNDGALGMTGAVCDTTISPAAWSAADVRLTYEKGIAR